MKSSFAHLLEGAEYWKRLVFVICFSTRLMVLMVVFQERQGQEWFPCLPFVLGPRLVVPGDLAECEAEVCMEAPETLPVKILTASGQDCSAEDALSALEGTSAHQGHRVA